MSETGLLRDTWSCGLLSVPILVWNIALTRFLPLPLASAEFWRDIPPLVAYGENASGLSSYDRDGSRPYGRSHSEEIDREVHRMANDSIWARRAELMSGIDCRQQTP